MHHTSTWHFASSRAFSLRRTWSGPLFLGAPSTHAVHVVLACVARALRGYAAHLAEGTGDMLPRNPCSSAAGAHGSATRGGRAIMDSARLLALRTLWWFRRVIAGSQRVRERCSGVRHWSALAVTFDAAMTRAASPRVLR
eukprot:7352448-Prymnesium_polylepis.2